MAISNKQNYDTFTESPLATPPACLSHYIENILNHSSGKCCDSLTMTALSFIKLTSFCTIFIH